MSIKSLTGYQRIKYLSEPSEIFFYLEGVLIVDKNTT